jgi:hypothetical protein
LLHAANTSPALNIQVAAASAGLAPSLVVISLMNSRNGNAVLKAEVIKRDSFARGAVSFLDQGSIPGSAMADSDGWAILVAS